jgi:hypothetical protein
MPEHHTQPVGTRVHYGTEGRSARASPIGKRRLGGLIHIHLMMAIVVVLLRVIEGCSPLRE